MTDETTTTTSRVARVLGEHGPAQVSNHVVIGVIICTCGHRVQTTPDLMWGEHAQHQADEITRAELVRDMDVRVDVLDQLGRPTHVRIEQDGVLIAEGFLEQPTRSDRVEKYDAKPSPRKPDLPRTPLGLMPRKLADGGLIPNTPIVGDSVVMVEHRRRAQEPAPRPIRDEPQA